MIVYKLTNKINGRGYIGITRCSLEKRWREHRSAAKQDMPWAISRAIRKHGAENFDVSILYEASSLEELKAVERGLIAEHGTLAPVGYNLTSGGDANDTLSRFKGEKSHKAILTDEIIGFIRDPINTHITNGDMLAVVSEKFGVTVSRDCLRDARRGDTWRHLNEKHPPIKVGQGKRWTERRASASRKNMRNPLLRSRCIEALKLRKGSKSAAKLTAAQAIEIFKDPRSSRKIAADYNVDRRTVVFIKRGVTWKDVTGGSVV